MIIYPRIKLTLITPRSRKLYWSPLSRSRRFFSKLSLAQFTKAIVRVEYGYDKGFRGKRVLFYNEGKYTNRKEAKEALRAFLEG